MTRSSVASALSETSTPTLVSAQWLQSHRDEVVVLDASITRSVDSLGTTQFSPGHTVFTAGHIGGAHFADLYSAFSDATSAFLFTRPTVNQLARAAHTVGINPATHVVVYDQLSGAYAARLWFVLRAFGFHRVSVLDGGFGAWVNVGGDVDQGAPVSAELDRCVDADHCQGEIDTVAEQLAAPAAGAFVDLDEAITLSNAASNAASTAASLAANTDQADAVLVCALRRTDYAGDPSRPGTGHIPGSVALPYPETLNPDGTVNVELTRSGLAELNLTERPVVAYCGGGVNAAGLALSMAAAGLAVPAIFDGSLSEWSSHPELPLVTGELPH